MREIKFRAWDVEQGKYHWGETNLMLGLTGLPYWQFAMDPPMPQMREQYILEQFTGLKDENGAEIYENDIVQFNWCHFDGNWCDTPVKGLIEYDADCMSYCLMGILDRDWIGLFGKDIESHAFSDLRFEEDNFEILGNLHQHPHLLNSD